MSKLDILFYLYGMDGGGAERHVLNLLQRLDRTRFSPRLYLESRDGPYLDRVPDDVPIEWLYPSFKDRRGRLPFAKEAKLVHALGRYIRSSPPDLVYARMYSSSLAAGLAIRWSRRPVPLVASEGIFPSVGILPDLGRYAPLLLPIVKKVQRDIASVIVCPARAMVDDSVSFYGCAREKMRVIPNGVDLEAMEGMKAEFPVHPWVLESGPTVVAAGRLCRQKGFDLLFEAFGRIAREFPAVRLIILGKGEERDVLRALADSLGISARVDFPGWLSNPHAVISRASVFVLSSRYEGFPNALLEAMACGTPVVSTDCPSGPREILEGGAGLLVPNENPAAMAKALQALLSDPLLRERVGRRGKARVEERYSLRKMVSAYERLFEDVVATDRVGLRAERKTPDTRSSSSE
ncbi:MAG: hypothetical protein H6Q84_328 [Deltaproteobacteria bacterium]|nr:hypothetical protein [Deltaproteobacteria bacterium]MBP2685120.1 hypothetical protein [Deltaproteobacteria bacterium]